ncbi:MAG: hypothetical protein HZA54_01895 [Planctomycetes bacterium]|nr:hypothetical protein [Planctomycetota bacterium]
MRRFDPAAGARAGAAALFVTAAVATLAVLTAQADPPQDFRRRSRAELLAAAVAGGDWIVGAQRKSGSFYYEYEPRTDRYDEATLNCTRHAGTAFALAQLYRATGAERFATAAERALRYLKTRRTRESPRGGDWRYVWEEPKCMLGASALALLAETTWEEALAARAPTPEAAAARIAASGLAEWAAGLARFLVFMQQPSGKFSPVYLAAEERQVTQETWLFYAEEATLALIRYSQHTGAAGGADWQAAAEAGGRYLIEEVPKTRAAGRPRTDAWLTQACRDLFRVTRAPRYADYALAAAEEWVTLQFTAFNARSAEEVGGFEDGAPVPMGPTAAARCEGLAAAYALTRDRGAPRADLERAIWLSLAFQLRHQYTAESAAAFAHPERLVGGVRLDRNDPSVRIDYTQHHVSSLLAAAEWAE